MARPSPHDGWIIDLKRLRREFMGRTAVDGQHMVSDLTLGVAAVSDGNVTVDLTVDATRNDVTVQGSLTSTWRSECRRCLGDVFTPIETDVFEVFQETPVEGETWPIDDHHIDLEPAMREIILLALPVAPLCGDDCRGVELDTDTHVLLETEEEAKAEAAEPAPDPRWAGLSELTFDE